MPPAPGVGRFIALIAARGLRILPAAGWEQDGALYVRFGVPYELHPPEDLPRDQHDQSISRFVMQRITENLPTQSPRIDKASP